MPSFPSQLRLLRRARATGAGGGDGRRGESRPGAGRRAGRTSRCAAALLAAAGLAAAAGPSPAQGTHAPAADAPALWFPVGEELTYKVYWGVMPIGKARIVARWVEQDGRRLLSIRYRARSSKVLNALYPVDDVVEALIDPQTFLPVRFSESINEGRSRKHEITAFDFTNRVAHWESRRKGKTQELKIEEDTRDIVTFMYFMRSQRLQPDDRKLFKVMADEKIYDLFVKVLGREQVKLPGFGTVSTLEMEPEAAFNGLFVRKGKLNLWVSDDERFVIVKVAARLPVASIRVVLSEVRGPGNDEWVRKTLEKSDEGDEKEDAEVERALRELDETQEKADSEP